MVNKRAERKYMAAWPLCFCSISQQLGAYCCPYFTWRHSALVTTSTTTLPLARL